MMEMNFMQMLEKNFCPCKSDLDGTQLYGGWTAALGSQPYILKHNKLKYLYTTLKLIITLPLQVR